MVSVIIPVYNESSNIALLLGQLRSVLSEGGYDNAELIVVDDGSTDGTGRAVADSGVKVECITNLINMGYGYSLKRGIVAANNDTILIIDGDGSYPLTNIPSLLTTYRRGFDLIVASREKHFVEDTFFKNIFRMTLRMIVEFTAGIKVPDVNSGMKIFSRKMIMPYFPYLSDMFSFTTSMTLHYALDKKTILFIPNGYHKRIGKSKVKLFRDMFRTLQFIVEIIAAKNPLKLHLLGMIPTFILIIASFISLFAGASSGLLPLLFFTSALMIQISIAILGVQDARK